MGQDKAFFGIGRPHSCRLTRARNPSITPKDEVCSRLAAATQEYRPPREPV